MPRILAAVLVLALAGSAHAGVAEVSRAVVRLYVTSQGWNLAQPWSKMPPRQSTCSGFFFAAGAVEGIMTNAHCVAEATFVQVEIQGLPDKVEAEVIAVAHQIDLALIRLRDRSLEAKLRKGLQRIRLADELPAYRDKVVTVGYPQGGQQISFTEGVVSRIDVMRMAHSGLPSLLVQTDAAINPGNSGGPVFADGSGRAVGVATQKISGGEGLGYVVPVPMIRQFLADLADGTIAGIPNFGITYQTLENDALRRHLGLRDGETGIRINEIARGSSADGFLQPNDVLLEIAGDPVYNDGRIPFRRDQRIGIGLHVFPRSIGERLPVRIARGPERLRLELPLKPYRFGVVPGEPAWDQPPRWTLHGGLVFLVVEPRYLWRWGGSGGSRVPDSLTRYLSIPVGFEDLEELVVVSEVYPAGVNQGYERGIDNQRVLSVNGVTVTTLGSLEAGFAAPATNPFHTIEVESGLRVVLDRARATADDEALRDRYGIPPTSQP